MRLRPNTSPADPALLAAIDTAGEKVMEAMDSAKELMERVREAHPEIEPGDMLELEDGKELPYKSPDQCDDEQLLLHSSVMYLKKKIVGTETLEGQREALLETVQSAGHMTIVGSNRPADFDRFCQYLHTVEETFMAPATFAQKEQVASLFKDAADYAALCKDARRMLVGLKAADIGKGCAYTREPTPYGMAYRDLERHYPTRVAEGRLTSQDMEWLSVRAITNLKQVMQSFEGPLPEPVYPEMMGIALRIALAEYKKLFSKPPAPDMGDNDNSWVVNPKIQEAILEKLTILFKDYRPTPGRELVELLAVSRTMNRQLNGGMNPA